MKVTVEFTFLVAFMNISERLTYMTILLLGLLQYQHTSMM